MDAGRRLIGVVELRDPVFDSADAMIADLVAAEPVSVRTADSAGRAAPLMRGAKLINLPVVDSEDRLVDLLTTAGTTPLPAEKLRIDPAVVSAPMVNRAGGRRRAVIYFTTAKVVPGSDAGARHLIGKPGAGSGTPTPGRCDGLHRCNFLQSVACLPIPFSHSRRTV
ncbi:CBS domain-containing protein [Nocardia sp. NPDC046763]|uniref:CBS domain-containing protein n=1 Tax=Nocardia sp. NPDC046763 TaxID=3155256 RepID=UPI0034057F8C